MKLSSLAAAVLLSLSLTACSETETSSPGEASQGPAPSPSSTSPTAPSPSPIGPYTGKVSAESLSEEDRTNYEDFKAALPALTKLGEAEAKGGSMGFKTLDEEDLRAYSIDLPGSVGFNYGGESFTFFYPSSSMSISFTGSETAKETPPKTFYYDGETIRTDQEVDKSQVSAVFRTDAEAFLEAARAWEAKHGGWPSLKQDFMEKSWTLEEFGFDSTIEPQPIDLKYGLNGNYTGSGDVFEATYTLETFGTDLDYDEEESLSVVGDGEEITVRYLKPAVVTD